MRPRHLLIGSTAAMLLAAVPGPRGGSGSSALGATKGKPVVSTRSGLVRGTEDRGIHVFKGIPFAAPPFGANRLRPPRLPESWEGVRDAFEFGPKAPQQAYPPEVRGITPPELVEPGEDCLTLNIWSNELGNARLPVMVWVAGGLFEFHATGASPWYDGSAFARDSVVCVTINYRVGADGFLFLDDGIANLGLLDQVAALEWVRDNITAFGGDPHNVTVFGESAGASSVAMLCAMPSAAGLFRRAIIQSGGAQHLSPAPASANIGRLFAEILGVPAKREAVAALSVEQTIAAQGELRNRIMANPDPAFWGEVALTQLPWQPTIDEDVLPASPLARLLEGAAGDIDVMVGTNGEETRLIYVYALDQITEELLAANIAGLGLPAEALAAYRALHPMAGPGDLMAAIMTDWGWRIPAMRLADAHAAGARSGHTHMYEFAWRSPQFGGRLGAAHSVEVPFVFDTLGHRTEHLLGLDPPQALADTMHAAWVSFASTGDPGWPEYDPDRRATMRFDVASAVVDDPLARERELWEGIR